MAERGDGEPQDRGLELRVAGLEGDVRELKADVKAIRADLARQGEALAHISGQAKGLPTTWVFVTTITVSQLTLTGIVAGLILTALKLAPSR